MLRKLSVGREPADRAASTSSRSDSLKRQPRFLSKGATVAEAEAAELALVSGSLFMPERVGPQKVWRAHFMALAPREEGGLGLFTLSEASGGILWKNSRAKLKVNALVELEEGCEVRPLDPDDVPGGSRPCCFMLVTSKSTMVFQAKSEEERARWLNDFGKEFQRHMEGNLLDQKFKLLRKGAVLVWHQPPAVSVKVALSSSGESLLLGSTEVPLSSVESVAAGKDATSLNMSRPEIFHFNCFMLRLKDDGKQINIETPKQSMRDEWVSALEAVLTANNATLDTGSGPGNSKTKTTRPSAAAADAIRRSANDQDASAAVSLTPGNSRSKAKTVVPARQSLNEQDLPDEAENATPAPAAPASGVGEFFKQKVKLGAGFPYSACISHALEVALQGEKASAVLTPPRPVPDAEFNEVVAHSKLEVPDSDKQKKPLLYEMTEYAPAAFHELRVRYEVSDLTYFNSLSRLSGDGAVGDGKSGMLFFFTEDRRYVLKTVKPNEMGVLIDKGMLGGYLRHMLDNPDSLICRFLGLYKFRMGPKGLVRDIILVCMQNSFDTRLVLHEKYDLKGSTRNRWCTPRFGSVLKDLNFGNSRIAFDAEDRAAFLKQCEKDTALMENFNVMDYSLLLGIHKPPEEDVAKTQRNLLLLAMAGHLEDRRLPGVGAKSGRPLPTRWQRDFGGVEGRLDGQPQVYIMCIIDILQAYDTGKKLENLIKSQMSEEIGKKEISAVNPKTYRERFLQYLERITIPVEGLNTQLQASRRALKLKLNEEDQDPRSPARRNTINVKKTLLTTVGEEESRRTMRLDREDVPITAASLPSAGLVDASRPLRPSMSESVKVRSNTLVDEGDKLKDEIAQAVREAEANKQTDGGGAAYTEVLEDGTEITVLENGGFIQTNPDGTVIRSFVDGRVHQTNPDGTTIETDADGLVVQHMPDGTEIVRKDSDAHAPKIQKNPDGTMIEEFPDGRTIQHNPDGSLLETLPGGDRITHFANGTVVERTPQGKITQRNPDGVVIVVHPDDGRTVQTDPTGVTLTTYTDGRTVQVEPSGLRIESAADGTEKHFRPDGVLLVVKNGKVISQSKMPI